MTAAANKLNLNSVLNTSSQSPRRFIITGHQSKFGVGGLKHITYNIHGELRSKHPVSCSSSLHIGMSQSHLR